MNKELVAPIKERVAYGQTKEQLKSEILQLGYSEADFESAYSNALSDVESDTVVPLVEPDVQTSSVSSLHKFLTPAFILLGFFIVGGGMYTYFSISNNPTLPEKEGVLPSVIESNTETQPLLVNEQETKTVATTTLGELSDVLLCKTVLPLLGVSDEDIISMQTNTTARLEVSEESISTIKEVTIKDVCIADIILTDKEMKQKLLMLYVANINEAYNTNFISLSTTDRLNLISEYELVLVRKKAHLATTKSSISRTYSEVLMCTDFGIFTEPKEGEKICVSQPYTWPVLSDYSARWGGCETILNTEDDYSFKYCATLPDGTVVTCTEDGCDFSGVN